MGVICVKQIITQINVYLVTRVNHVIKSMTCVMEGFPGAVLSAET